MVVDAPRRLARRVAVAEQVGREDPVRPGEPLGEPREVPAPRRDAVQADDLRRAVVAPGADMERSRVDGSPSRVRGAVGHQQAEASRRIGPGRPMQAARGGREPGPDIPALRDPGPRPPRGVRGPLESRYPADHRQGT